MAKIDEYRNLKQEVLDNDASIRNCASEEVAIDEFDLDGESLKTPKLHSRWMSILGDEAARLVTLQNLQKKVYLERWKYYNGKQPDSYYREHGVVHDKILKGDIGMYLDADEYVAIMKEIVNAQSHLVDFLEKTIKEISSRTFHLKNAIEWRRFESGS